MASTYSTQGRLELQATGENSGTWGSKTNTNLQLIEAMVDGYVSVAFASDANDALTTANASADESRNKVIKLTGTLTASRLMEIPAVEKVYIINNATTGGFSVTIGVSGNTVATIANGSIGVVYCDGTNTYQLTYYAPGGTDVAVADGGTGSSTASDARTALGLAIGTDVQAYDAGLADVAGVAVTDGNFLVGDGANWVAESGDTARISLGVGTTDSPQFAAVNVGAATDTTVTRVSAGLIAVEGDTVTLNTATQTLTNKTLTSPAINSGTLTTAVAAGTWTVSGTWTIPAVTAGGQVSMADQILSRPQIEDYAETVNAIGSIGGGTQDIDLTLGNVVSGTVDTSTTTFTFSNPSATGKACSFTLLLANGGSQTVNWPASVVWQNGIAPVLTTSGVDILTFFTVSAGATWYGFVSGQAMA